jgi:hypothetical protein
VIQTETVLVVGKKGTGKTTWARKYVQNKTRVVVADAGFGEFGFKTVYSFPELLDELKRGFFRVNYTPMSWEWPLLIEAIMIAGSQGGEIWFVLEEASRLPSPRSCEEYERLLIMGRHYNVHLMALSTRPAHLPPDYRSQATKVVAFRQHEQRDLEYLEGIIGDRAEELPGLALFKNVEWRDTDERSRGEGERHSSTVGNDNGAETTRQPAIENSGDDNRTDGPADK